LGEKVEIYSSKKKAFLLLIYGIILVALNIYLYISADDLTRSSTQNPTTYRLIAVFGCLFFGAGLFMSIKMLLKSRLMLVIDHKGINLKPTDPSTEILPWNEILSFEKAKIRSTKFLIVHVKKPYSYLEKEHSILRGMVLAFNLEKYKSPLNIGVSSMDIGFKELEELLNKFLIKYGTKC